MFSPYEELEQLVEHLPDEGESLIVTRRDGELVYEPKVHDDMLDGIEDASLYGHLVLVNERLNALGSTPLWSSVLGFTVVGLVAHAVLGPWNVWYVLPVLGLSMMYLSFLWIRQRQHQCFVRVHLPRLLSELRRRRLDPYSLIAGVRQHPELNTLLDELTRWEPRSAM